MAKPVQLYGASKRLHIIESFFKGNIYPHYVSYGRPGAVTCRYGMSQLQTMQTETSSVHGKGHLFKDFCLHLEITQLLIKGHLYSFMLLIDRSSKSTMTNRFDNYNLVVIILKKYVI